MRARHETGGDRTDWTRYGDLRFDPDLLTAIRDDGETIRFTRQERALLQTMASRPGRLFTRDQLLAAIVGDVGLATDRQVDFVINRVRRKLRDSIRTPRFIATQYGEGYVWIAPARRPGRTALAVIGPVRGLDRLSSSATVREGLEKLHRRLMDLCLVGEEIAFNPDARPAGGGELQSYRFAVRVDLHGEGEQVQAAFSLTDDVEGRLLRVVRRAIPPGAPDDILNQVAEILIDALWRGAIRAPDEDLRPSTPPLELRMEAAALSLSPSREIGWRYLAAQARRALERDGDDGEAAIMLASCLFARRIFDVDFDGADAATYVAAGDEIERLVLPALRLISRDPLLRLAAARLLFGIHRGHLPTVQSFLSETLACSAAFAASSSLSGLIKTYLGDLAGALESYDQALALAEPGTDFEVYLQRRKAEVFLAIGERARAVACLERALGLRPHDALLQVLRLDPERPLEPAAAQLLSGLTREAGRQVLGRLIFGLARNYSRPEHAARVIAGPMRHLVARFGLEVLPLATACELDDDFAGRR